jgi:hypothetical protein
MRLGFERKPLQFGDLLWPSQRVPRSGRLRRKGRMAPVEVMARAQREGTSCGQATMEQS